MPMLLWVLSGSVGLMIATSKAGAATAEDGAELCAGAISGVERPTQAARSAQRYAVGRMADKGLRMWWREPLPQQLCRVLGEISDDEIGAGAANADAATRAWRGRGRASLFQTRPAAWSTRRRPGRRRWARRSARAPRAPRRDRAWRASSGSCPRPLRGRDRSRAWLRADWRHPSGSCGGRRTAAPSRPPRGTARKTPRRTSRRS